jgi:serine/threonine protein kinase
MMAGVAQTIVSNQSAGILQSCRACGHEFRAPKILVGRSIPCPHCRKPLVVADVVQAVQDRLVGREVGGCTLIKRLGAGALGVVYEAEQRSTARKIAVKMLSGKAAADQEVVARFYREAKLCAKIRHPHVVEVYDCGLDPKAKVHYLVMELVEGATFAGLIEEHGRLPWSDAVAYTMQIADALVHVHGQAIIHRDIKPANILVSYEGHAKLADLGLAKQIDAAASLTVQGVAMGSPAYMPPEQIRDASSATPRSDLYALGATLYQALSGCLPFDGRTASEVMEKVLKTQAPPLNGIVPDLPLGVVAVCDRLLSKEPERRPKDAQELVNELAQVVKDPTRVPPTTSQARLRGATARRAQSRVPGGLGLRAWLMIAGAAAVLATAVIVAWLAFRH